MKIDIDRLSEAELVELNHRIVARLRMLLEMRSHSSMLEFRVGERVSLQADGGRMVTGTLVRYNRKTVSLVTDDGQRWNVSPQLLRRVVAEMQAGAQPGTVVPFRKE